MSKYIMDLCKTSNRIKIDTLISQVTDNVYHYTSPGGMNGIIFNGKLRFSDRYYLNDASEGRYAIQLCIDNIDNLGISNHDFKDAFLKECIGRLAKPQRDNFYIFQCSFSLDPDSLCLWNYYTKGDSIKGFNLAFQADKLLEGLTPTPLEADGRCPKAIGGKVIYHQDEQLSIIKSIVSSFTALSEIDDYYKYDRSTVGLLLDKIMFAGVFFKKECFAIEKEYRIAFDLFLKADGTYASIEESQQFRELNGIFIPFVDIQFDKTSLKRITLSPTLEIESTTQSIQRMLKNEYPAIKGKKEIVSSEIPVRY